MNKEILNSRLAPRLLVIGLAAGAITNCGQNMRTMRSGVVAPEKVSQSSLTGVDASRNTITIARDATSTQCPSGGKINIRYDDSDGNAQPSPGELVRDATIDCYGGPGQPDEHIVSREVDPDNQTCSQGGLGFVQFVDRDRNGTYDPTRGDRLIGTPQIQCFNGPSSGRGHPAIGKTFRAAALADCPASGGKGDVIQFFFDLNGDGHYEPNQGETLAAEIPACATPKNLAAIQAVVPSVTQVGNCSLYSFAPPTPTDGSPAPQPVTIKSCNTGYSVGFLETTPDTRTCPAGGVMLASYIDEDHDGLINTPSERNSAVAPHPLCFGKSGPDGQTVTKTIATTAAHVSTLNAQCTRSGGNGTTYTTFVSRDGSGVYKAATASQPADAVLSTFSVCDSLDGKPVEAPPVIFPQARTATSDELKQGHCSGASAIVTQSRLFANLASLQSWLKNHGDVNNQGQVLGDANIVCLGSSPGSVPFATTPAPSATPSQAVNAGGNAPLPMAMAMAPIIRTVSSVLPAADGQCTDGSKWVFVTFKDHAGDGIYRDADGPALYQGCLNELVAPKVMAGTHTDVVATKIPNTADFPNGGYTFSIYRNLTKGQALDSAQHQDITVPNGPVTQGTAINIKDVNDYTWTDPKKAPKERCDGGVVVVNFYDTDGNGVFNFGKTPVLNEFAAFCPGENVHVRWSTPKDKGCESNGGPVLETFLDKAKKGHYVETDPITETIAACSPPAVQPPPQPQQDCAYVDQTIRASVTKLTPAELSDPELRAALPYKVKSGKVGVGTYGSHRTSPDGTEYVENTQVLYRVSFNLPPQDYVKDLKSVSVSMTLAGVKSLDAGSHPDASLFCLMDGDFPLCSGKRYSGGTWEKLLNPIFWKNLPNGRAGEGKYAITNEEFSKRLFSETTLKSEDLKRYKYIPGLEISFGDLFPELDQARFLYSGVGNTGTREFLVEIADDTYASMLRFEATMKLPVCRNVMPVRTDAILAAATSGT